MSRYEKLATLGDWTFYQVTDHGFGQDLADKPLYGFALAVPDGTAAGKPKLGELYVSLEHAMVAAVGEKYTGPRGAGGTGVGTAADWFMRMIGADQLVPVENPCRVLSGAADVAGISDPITAVLRMNAALRSEGYTLAKINTGEDRS